MVTYIPDAGPYVTLIRGLIQGKSYFVLVRAGNSQGYGDGQQTTPTFEHPRQEPKAPLNVRIAATSESMITVGYDLPNNDGGDPVTEFLVEWDTNPMFEGTGRLPHKGSIVKTAGTDRFQTITNLSPGATYYVRVRAGNKVGFGAAASDPMPGATPALTQPGRVANVRAVSAPASSTACSTIQVSFTAPFVPASGLFCGGGGTDPSSTGVPSACPRGMGFGQQADGGSAISGYEIQYATYPDFRDAKSKTVPVVRGQEDQAVVTFIRELQSGQEYYIRVAARNSIGVGPFCNREDNLCDGAYLKTRPSAAC